MKFLLFGLLLLIAVTIAQQCLETPVQQCFQSTCGFNTPAMNTNNTACRPCGLQDMGAKFTTCGTDGTKSLIFFWKPPATCVSTLGAANSVLPSPIGGFPCDFHCHAGEYIDQNTKTCVPCSPGSFAHGEDRVIENFARIPSQMRTYCNAPNNRCNPWRPQGSYIDSGNNNNFLGVSSILEFSVELTDPTSTIYFEYQYNAEDPAHSFLFSANGNLLADLANTNGTDSWSSFYANLTAGYYTFQWIVKNAPSIFSTNQASIRQIVVKGLEQSAAFCTPCEPGFYSDGKSPCKACPLNSFSNTTSAVSCTACPKYQITTDIASTSCIADPHAVCKASDYYDDASDCANGQRTITTKLIAPVLCDPTHPQSYVPVQPTRTESCTSVCKVGQIANAQGVCEYCAKGFYINSTLTACKPCPFGSGTENVFYVDKFNAKTSSLFRTGCFGTCRSGWRMKGDSMDSGYGNGYSRSWFQMDLTIESKTPTVDVEFTLSCPLGAGGLAFFAAGRPLKFIPCSGCSTTKQNVTLSLANIVPSNALLTFGGVFVKNNPDYSNLECNVAQVSLLNIQGSEFGGAEECVPCPAGTNADEFTNCDACPAGSFSGMGAINCTKCAAGSFSVPGSASCVKCGDGFSAPVAGSPQCTYTAGINSYSGMVGSSSRFYNWNKTASLTEKQIFGIASTPGRFFLNLRLDPKNPHPVCGNAIACYQDNFFAATSLGEIVSVNTFLTSAEAGLLFKAKTYYPNCNSGANYTTSTIKFVCDPSLAIPAVAFEQTNQTCDYKITIASQEACPACTADDYYNYRGECINDQQVTQYIRRMEPSRLCFGGFQQDLSPKTLECNPFTVYVEGPVWALVIVALIILILLIIIAVAVVTGVVLIVKNRQLYAQLTDQAHDPQQGTTTKRQIPRQ